MAEMGFYIDMTSCIGCHTCQIACKDAKSLEVGTLFRRVDSYETGSFPTPGWYHYSHTCNHCESPACVANCPTGAMHVNEEDGSVQHDDETCIGCQTCVKSCPYSVPQYIEELGVVHKCDMCHELTAAGENPACVDACLMRCIEWGEVEKLKAAHPDAVNKIACMPDSDTEPSTLITPTAAALKDEFRLRVI